MIPTIVKPADDELFSTWMSHILQLNGAEKLMDQQNFLNEIVRSSSFERKDYQYMRYFPNIELLCKIEEKDPLFPNLQDILHKHTDIYAMMPFRPMGETGKVIEYCLRGSGKLGYFYGKVDNDHGIKICPECAREDEIKYGRMIVHVQHQLTADVCWKHGCILRYKDTGEPVKEQILKYDMDIAVLMHDLYENPITAHLQMLMSVLKKGFSKDCIPIKYTANVLAEEGYISGELVRQDALSYKRSKIYEDACKIHTAAAAKLFHDRDHLADSIGEWNPLSEYTFNDFEPLSSSDIIMRFQCKECGRIFWMNPIAAQYGDPCPECAGKMSKVQIYQRYADRMEDGEYNIYEENGKIHVIHVECGRDSTYRFPSYVWWHTGCSFCSKMHRKAMHVGEKKRNFDGQMMEITAWHGHEGVDILLENGTTITRKYSHFCEGKVCLMKQELCSTRVGEMKRNKAGYLMKIIRYNGSQDCTVEFEDGTQISGVTYNSFKLGNIAYPGYRKDSRIGMEKTNNQGFLMKIIDYRNYKDVDVQFSINGTIVRHKMFSAFVHGRIRHPYTGRLLHNGEKKFDSYENMEMEIIDYRSCREVLIRFGDGTIVARSYAQFRQGNIRIKKNEKKKQS